MIRKRYITVCFILIVGSFRPLGGEQLPAGSESWVTEVLEWRTDIAQTKKEGKLRAGIQQTSDTLERKYPVEWDWLLQDGENEIVNRFKGSTDTQVEENMIRKVLEELGRQGKDLQEELERLRQNNIPYHSPGWFRLYHRACGRRREIRLAPLLEKWKQIVFTKHYNLGGSHYAYTEGQSDAQRERHFIPGAALCVLEMKGAYGRVHTLINDPQGVIRDPDVSYDGERILFAWKKSDRQDDYHLYEIHRESREIRQLTFGLGFADYEGTYLPNGDIIFNSTRCVQIVDCWWTEVSNLYTCDKDGRFLRRLTFDQVHTNFPTVLEDGRIIYTRWEYNDRGQVYSQPLYQMQYDGTGQTEYYGNNSWFPTTVLHARGIPGTQKVLGILSGHHCHQRGKLGIFDPARGRQENSGVQLVAPVRQTEAVRIDSYGQDGEQFQYPYPLSNTAWLVTYSPYHSGNRNYQRPYGIYFQTIDGRRELLVWDAGISCNQPVPLAPRALPPLRPSLVDYHKKTGTYYLQDIYVGAGLKGIERGTIKKLRVVTIRFRPAGIGETYNQGPGGGSLASTPVGVGNTSWDVKEVLGEAKVYEDGSACFTVPARTPVYFQALDENGYVVQTMRSWSTLQPNETYSCVGCHEQKKKTPALHNQKTLAMKAGAETLKPFYGPPRGFSFAREVQPILDRHCIRCHNDREAFQKRIHNSPTEKHNRGKKLRSDKETTTKNETAFSLLADQTVEACSKRKWSDAYLALTGAQAVKRGRSSFFYRGRQDGEVVNWINNMSVPTMLPPYYRGAARSKLLQMMTEGHKGVKLSREERDKLACWIDLLVPYCGDYTEANAWTQKEKEMYNHYLAKQKNMEKIEQLNIEKLTQHQTRLVHK